MSPEIVKAFREHPDLSAICGMPHDAVPQAGLTNRVYRLESETGSFFLRLPRSENAGLVDRIAEARNLELAADLGLALPPLYLHCGEGLLLTRAVDVQDRPPRDFPVLLGQALGRLHASGLAFRGELDPDKVYRAQRDRVFPAKDLWPEMSVLDQAFQDLSEDPEEPSRLVPVHGDLSPGNCLSAPGRLWLIDWEYSAMSDPAWDLAYAILEHGFSEDQERAFLAAYGTRQAPEISPSAGRLDFMKARCDAVSALWALEQVARGRNSEVFLPFARERRDRALARLGELN